MEGGKPLKWAKVEAARGASTFRWAAEEARREGGSLMRLDTEALLGSRLGLIRRFPMGPMLAIAPFNFPVILSPQDGPRVSRRRAGGGQPATKTPLGARFWERCSQRPISHPGCARYFLWGGSTAGEMAADDRFAKISFTGSSEVGWKLREAVPKKAVTLELGGNAGVIVHDDADVARAAQRVAFGGYYQAGQSCIAARYWFTTPWRTSSEMP